MIDALSQHYTLLSKFQFMVIGFEIFEDLYVEEKYFGGIWKLCQ